VRKLLPALVVAAACAASFDAAPARAESSQGGAFRLPGYGARAWGMAGAVVARIDDESALDWNPAGMASCPRTIGASYVDLVPGASLEQSQLVFVTPLGTVRDAGTHVARHVVGAMFTNVSADVGDEMYSENHLRAAYAFTPEPLVTVAIAAQGFMSSSGVPGFDAWGTSVDLGARVSISERWSVGLVGRDAFSRYSYDDGRDYQKERQYLLGLARNALWGVDVEGDVVYSYGGWTRTQVGAESGYLFGHVSLRGGVAFYNAGESRVAYTFGASACAARARLFVHYAASIDDEDAFGTTHRVSLGVRM
jgi:hypothetical protein